MDLFQLKRLKALKEESARLDDDGATDVCRILDVEEAVLSKGIGGGNLEDVVIAREVAGKRCLSLILMPPVLHCVRFRPMKFTMARDVPELMKTMCKLQELRKIYLTFWNG
ncbi:hypothetical protein TNCV_1602661 [Trichonephila clavipes]|nr:hypothetical protein TNCV_1602661 [Trichonephila clavipes]